MTTDAPRPPGLRRLYAALWHFARGHRHVLLAALGLLLASQMVKLAVPYLAGQAINTLQLQGLPGLAPAGGWLLLVFGATVCSWLLHGPGRVLERNVALVVRERVSAALVDRLNALPLAWHEGQHSGATAFRVQQSSRALYDFAQSQFIVLQNAVRLVGPVAALALIDPWVGAAALLGLSAISVSILGFDRAMIRLAAAENEAERRYTAALVDAMANIVSVRALRQARGVAARVAARLQAIYAPVRRAIVVNESKWCAVDLLSQALSCGLLALYAWRAARGLGGGGPVDALVPPTPTLALGQVYMVWEYALQAGGVISAVASQFQTLARQHADHASGDLILDAPATPLAQAEAAPPAERAWTQLAVQGLEFRHGATPAGLHGVQLSLQRGRRYAVVGGSGAGKSTLLRVLAGLHLPQQARWAVDAQAPRDALGGARWLRARSTLIPQEAEVFEGSVAENLALCETVDGPPDPARFTGALQQACADAFLAPGPAGLAAELSERGSTWSGGQRQRLALARGLLAAEGSSLLMLDEPTSALDPRTEQRVLAQIFEAHAEACVLASVHRLSLLDAFDEVIVMEAGRVVGQGSVAQLQRGCPAFVALRAAAAAGPADQAAGATAGSAGSAGEAAATGA